MRKKTQKVYDFINNLHESIVTNPQFRKNVADKTEVICPGGHTVKFRLTPCHS